MVIAYTAVSLAYSVDLANVVDQLVSADRRPSHDELSGVFRRAGVAHPDPGAGIGKVKRVRAVASYCLSSDDGAGARLVVELVGAVRAEAGFVSGSDQYVGDTVVANVRRALATVGYVLDAEGGLAPRLLDNAPEADRYVVLRQYADRLRRGAFDSPLVTGTGKDLLEATARHVLVQGGGQYDPRMGFPGTLLSAYTVLGLSAPPGALIQGQVLDADPVGQLQQAVFLLGLAVNRLRNADGTGHGRPYLPSVTERQAELASQAIALATELLLKPR
jgi:hypothetical protein